MIFKNRQKRKVRHYGIDDAQPEGIYSYGKNPDFEKPKKKHRFWKWFGLGLLLLIILASIAALLVYLYIDTTVLKGEKEGRINIMVLGVDDAAELSDSIMVISIDTRYKEQPKAALISVPRDLYVDIPEFGPQKINAAYTEGQNYDYPGGGAALSQATLEEVLGIPIHYYATLDFTGFKELINSVGGIDVDVKQPIDDPYYPDYADGYSYFGLPAGMQHLDGEQALRYARSRQTSSDFDRAARQQQILLAYKNKVIRPDTLLDLDRLEKIQDTIKGHFKTNMSVREMAKLAKIVQSIPDGMITRHVIDNTNYLESSYISGSSILIPRIGVFEYAQIQEFVKNIFNQTSNTLPEAQQ